MAKTAKKPKTAAKKGRPASAASSARRLKASNYKSFRLAKKIRHAHKKLPGSLKLFAAALGLLKKHWKIFVGITVIYILISLILVHGLSSHLNIAGLKDDLKEVFSGKFGDLSTSAILFAYLVGAGSFSASNGGGPYQLILLLIVSLAIIWTLRKLLAGEKVKIRDGFYRGMYPFIPFILVLLVIGLQLIPLAIGSWLYGTVSANAIAVTALEKVMWAVFSLLLAILSLYMICSSLFALYIVTLPEMTPMKALRSARQLVLHRRWEVMRKVIFLPILLIIIGALIFMPLSLPPTCLTSRGQTFNFLNLLSNF